MLSKHASFFLFFLFFFSEKSARRQEKSVSLADYTPGETLQMYLTFYSINVHIDAKYSSDKIVQSTFDNVHYKT